MKSGERNAPILTMNIKEHSHGRSVYYPNTQKYHVTLILEDIIFNLLPTDATGLSTETITLAGSARATLGGDAQDARYVGR